MSIGLSETVTIGRKSEMIATQMMPRGMMYPLMSVDVSAMFASVYLIVCWGGKRLVASCEFSFSMKPRHISSVLFMITPRES